MKNSQRVYKRIKVLGGAASAAALMAASAQAATAFDLAAGIGSAHAGLPEPATLMIVGTALLVAFRARPHA